MLLNKHRSRNRWNSSDSLLILTSASETCAIRVGIDTCWSFVLTLSSASGRAAWSHSVYSRARTWNTPAPPAMPSCTSTNACKSQGDAVTSTAILRAAQEEKALSYGIIFIFIHIQSRYTSIHTVWPLLRHTYMQINCYFNHFMSYLTFWIKCFITRIVIWFDKCSSWTSCSVNAF